MELEKFQLNLGKMIESKTDEIRQSAATEFAYAILYETRKKIDHSWDPPWDCSGRLVDTKENFNIEDYETLNDFLEEYNGLTWASHESGCGFFHEIYENYFETIILEDLSDYQEELFLKLSKKSKERLLKDIDSEVQIDESELYLDFVETVGWDLIFGFGMTIMENLGKTKAKDLFKEGESLAKKKD